MPRYDYECENCGHREEQSFSMADMPQAIGCVCGLSATRVIDTVPEGWMKDRPFEFDRSKNVRSNGRLFGKSDQKHHEHYRTYFEDLKNHQRKAKRSGHKQQARWIGGMPGEMADSINEHEGKETVQKDPVTFLKKTGLYAGD